MPLQRVREDESRAGNKPPNGPRRAQSKASAEYSATWGIRQLPGICERIPQSARETVKQGGTANDIRPWQTNRLPGFFYIEPAEQEDGP